MKLEFAVLWAVAPCYVVIGYQRRSVVPPSSVLNSTVKQEAARSSETLVHNQHITLRNNP
jgi:hypothetical protein